MTRSHDCCRALPLWLASYFLSIFFSVFLWTDCSGPMAAHPHWLSLFPFSS